MSIHHRVPSRMQALFSRAFLFPGGKPFPEALRRLFLISHWPELGYMLISWPITSKENGLPWLTRMMQVYFLGWCTLLPDKQRVFLARRRGIATSRYPRVWTSMNLNAPAEMLHFGSSSYLLTEDTISEANIPCRCILRSFPNSFFSLLL